MHFQYNGYTTVYWYCQYYLRTLCQRLNLTQGLAGTNNRIDETFKSPLKIKWCHLRNMCGDTKLIRRSQVFSNYYWFIYKPIRNPKHKNNTLPSCGHKHLWLVEYSYEGGIYHPRQRRTAYSAGGKFSYIQTSKRQTSTNRGIVASGCGALSSQFGWQLLLIALVQITSLVYSTSTMIFSCIVEISYLQYFTTFI